MKKSTKTANISATFYDGEFQVLFDCCGVDVCKFALCHMMPPSGNEECTYRENGSCSNPPAQFLAIEKLLNHLKKELKERVES